MGWFWPVLNPSSEQFQCRSSAAAGEHAHLVHIHIHGYSSHLSASTLFLYTFSIPQSQKLLLFFPSKDRQSPNSAEYKEQKKREKQRLEREKKEQKERERKDNEMKKKFKVCSSKSPSFIGDQLLVLL